jgi:hypothetical protein
MWEGREGRTETVKELLSLDAKRKPAVKVVLCVKLWVFEAGEELVDRVVVEVEGLLEWRRMSDGTK